MVAKTLVVMRGMNNNAVSLLGAYAGLNWGFSFAVAIAEETDAHTNK